MHKKITLALVLAATLGVSACGVGPDKSREDANDTTNVDKTPPRVIGFNNHFPNIETKCDGVGHRIYVGSHDSSKGDNIIVIPDPSCSGYTADTAKGLAVTGK